MASAHNPSFHPQVIKST